MRISDWSSDVCSSDLPPPKRDQLSFSPHRAAFISQGTMIGDLQFERRIALPCWKAGVHGATTSAVEQGRGITAMHRADRIEDLARRRTLENDASALYPDESELKHFADRRMDISLHERGQPVVAVQALPVVEDVTAARPFCPDARGPGDRTRAA